MPPATDSSICRFQRLVHCSFSLQQKNEIGNPFWGNLSHFSLVLLCSSPFYCNFQKLCLSKRHLCDMQFTGVACAFKTQTAMLDLYDRILCVTVRLRKRLRCHRQCGQRPQSRPRRCRPDGLRRGRRRSLHRLQTGRGWRSR